MSKKKNDIKTEIDTCFFCGKSLNKLDDKRVHRIDLKKNVKETNVVILCEFCECMFQRVEKRIFNFGFDFEVIKRYFKNKSIRYKNIIIGKIYNQKIKFQQKQKELEK